MIKFLHPQYLLLTLLLFPSAFFYIRRVRKLIEIIETEKIAKRYFNIIKCRTLFFSISFSFLCVALSTPMYGTRLLRIQKKGASLLFVMDISNSMTIKEMEVSRLSWAKYIANYTIEKYPNIAFGLVIAKGNGVLSIPLTFEHDVLEEQISSLSPSIMSEAGTNLEKGILKAVSSFYSERGDFRSLFLFTDGDETKGDLMRTVKEIAKNNIFLVIVGVGNKEGGTIEILDEDGKRFAKHSILEEEKLKKMAKLCDGIYVRGDDFASLKNVFDILDDQTAEKEQISFKKEDKNRTSEASFLSLLFFCLGVLIEMSRFRSHLLHHCNLSSTSLVNHLMRNR